MVMCYEIILTGRAPQSLLPTNREFLIEGRGAVAYFVRFMTHQGLNKSM